MFCKGSALLLAAALLGITGACDDETQIVATLQQLLPQAGTHASAPGQPSAPGTINTNDINVTRNPDDPFPSAPGHTLPETRVPDLSDPDAPTDPADLRGPDGPRTGLWRFVRSQTGHIPSDGVVEFEVRFVVAADSKGLFIDSLEYDTVLACGYQPPFDLAFDFVNGKCKEDEPILNRRAQACSNREFTFEFNFIRDDFAELTIHGSQAGCPDWGDSQAIVVDASLVQ